MLCEAAAWAGILTFFVGLATLYYTKLHRVQTTAKHIIIYIKA